MPNDAATELAGLIDLATPFAIRTAVALSLPGFVADGITGTAELAAACGSDHDSLARLLRHLVSVGLFTEAAGEYGLTALSRELLSEDRRWQLGWLDLSGPGAKMDLAYSGMLHSVRTGEAAYGRVHGVEFWADYQRDEQLRLFFGSIMAAHTWQTGPALAAEYDWSGVRRVLDVGGGIGALLTEILLKQPHLTGAVLDLPPVRPEAEQALADAGLAGRAEFVGGSFFDPLPAGYDVLLISRVLTDWNDEDAVKILRRGAEAAGTDGKVVVVEVLAGAEHAKNNSSFDLQSLTLLGGRERTVADFHALAAAAGLAVRRTHQGEGGLLVVECAAD